MVLAAVDDLLFSSKIRTVGQQVGAELVFARTSADILEQARARRPALIVFDLNSPKMDAVATIAAIKADPELSGVPVLGFASHVHTELIAAAQKAGADQVLPRSAFAARLAEILAT